MKKFLCVMLSVFLLGSSVSFAIAANEPSDSVAAIESTTASSVSVQRLSVVPDPLPFEFEIISAGRETVTVEFAAEGRITVPPYVGEKGTKTAAEKTGNLQYILEYDKEYSFAYTVTEGENEIVYNSFVTVEQGSETEVVFGEVIRNIVPSEQSRSSGTWYEEESNDTMFSADFTYDDYDNYGTISSEDDVDWWVVEFDQDGWANFWVGEIPAGCDYDILLYDEDCQGTAIDWLEESINPDQTPELIQWEVEAGVYYYVRIAAYEGYSSTDYYLFRAKYYPTHPDDWEPETEAPEPEPEIPTIPSGAIGVHVTDEMGAPIPDAVVYVYPQKFMSPMFPCAPAVTDESGYAIVTGLSASQTYGVNVIADDYAAKSISSFVSPSTSFCEVTLDDRYSIQLCDPFTGFSSANQWSHGGGLSKIGCTSVCSQFSRLCPHEHMNVDSPQNFGWRYDMNSLLEFHQGVDASKDVSENTTLYNVFESSARVTIAELRTDTGNTVQLYKGGLYATYMHLSLINAGVEKDKYIAGGSAIGKLGGTGTFSSGIHLHLSLGTSNILWVNRTGPINDEYTWTSAQIESFIDPLAYIN